MCFSGEVIRGLFWCDILTFTKFASLPLLAQSHIRIRVNSLRLNNKLSSAESISYNSAETEN